ncbi:hypothetical protein [Hyphobacterium marinum]|uniref:Uncharacterized protein n=1 Tax=Hyphobacterium marinum TaxID=3116574 RepID=A0ABU7LXD7_9PROT|nr:hypothetical protein [Hyphobacterium sp. Y6023]MEE2566218.1 hypothetical protein [Hyphobacterium sp. Y6023]
MNWTSLDFLVAGLVLLVVSGGALTVVVLVRSAWHRAGLAIAGLTAIALFWVNGAVGIIGSEANDANALFLGVYGVGALGALLSHFHARGLTWTLLAMAGVQALIGLIAWLAGWGADGNAWPRDIALATGLFTAGWLAAAYCFHRATRI